MKKKLFSLLLATVLIMGLSVNAFAEGTPTDMTQATIKVLYKLNGDGISPAETFTVAQTAKEVKDGEATTAPDLGVITGAAYDAGGATATGAEKTITIALPTYSSVGVYEYTLTPQSGKTAGVTYYDKTIKLVVTVINDGTIRVAAVHAETKGAKSDTIDYTYTANKLNVKKIVAGNLGDKDKPFDFTVTFTAPSGKTWTNAITTSGGATELSQTDNEYTFKLKHDATETFANIPEGVTYTVAEEDYQSEGYTTTKTGDTGTMGAEEKNAEFTNTKEQTVDTGVILDNLPYVLILAILAGAVVALRATKKRRG